MINLLSVWNEKQAFVNLKNIVQDRLLEYPTTLEQDQIIMNEYLEITKLESFNEKGYLSINM